MSRIAVLNAGTATLKVAVLNVRGVEVNDEHRKEHAWDEAGDPDVLIREALDGIDARVDAIGHRVVHGGPALRDTVRIDAGVEAEIERFTALAPMHNARALQGIRGARSAFPDLPAFAVFDAAFHAGRPAESMCYAMPGDLVDALELRRYGFHGTAHASLAEGLAAACARPKSEITAVTLQLGSGCSAAALDQGRSIETSMGYTPLEGLVMTSRCGDIDPAIVIALARAGHKPDDIERALTLRSGLEGLAGSSDVREILAREARGDEQAQLALRVFVRRMVMTIGAYFTLLDGRGALVFGGGIGTHSAEIRKRVAAGLAAWNVALDAERNEANAPGRISTPKSREVFVLRTDEERIIAREAARSLDAGGRRSAPRSRDDRP